MSAMLRIALLALLLTTVVGLLQCSDKSSPTGTLPDPSGRGSTWRVASEPSLTATGIAASPTTLVVVEPEAGVRVSTNGHTWTRLHLAYDYRFNVMRVLYGNGKFVLFGPVRHIGSAELLVSVDGYNWQDVQLPVDVDLLVTHAPGKFLAVGQYDKTVLTSVDAITWTVIDTIPLPGEADDEIQCVTWAGNQFVVMTERGYVLVSPDGHDWQNIPQAPYALAGMFDILYGSNRLVAVGASGRIAVSDSNAQSWHIIDNPEFPIAFTSISWSAEHGFVAVGNNDVVAYSRDGTTWELANLPRWEWLDQVVWWRDRYLAVHGKVWESPDGSTWQVARSIKRSPALRDITWGPRGFVAVGPTTILWSPNGEQWSVSLDDTSANFTSVTWTGVNYVAVSSHSSYGRSTHPTIYKSSDAAGWDVTEIPVRAAIVKAQFLHGKLFLLGSRILVSDDHANRWNSLGEETWGTWRGITYGNGQYVAAGDYGMISTSPDGLNWAAHLHICYADLVNVVWSGTAFTTVNEWGEVLRSDYGTNWQLICKFSGSFLSVRNIFYDGYQFIVVGDQTMILTSPNGLTWANHYPKVIDSYSAVAANDVSLVIVGENGSILISP